MEKDKYDQAKYLREKIDHFTVKMNQIQAIKPRKDDDEFNMLMGLAFDGCEFAVKTFEQKFKEL